MIPVYAFLEGDTLGLVIMLDEGDTVGAAIAKTQRAGDVRVAPRDGMVMVHAGRALNPAQSVERTGIKAFDRIDVVHSGGP